MPIYHPPPPNGSRKHWRTSVAGIVAGGVYLWLAGIAAATLTIAIGLAVVACLARDVHAK